jgi:Xaa-Pro aminopeptidase
MYPHQLDRLNAALDHAQVDAVVATSPANVVYATGFRSLSRTVYPLLDTAAVFARGGTALIVPTIDAAAVAAAGLSVDHVCCYGAFFSDFAEHTGEDGRRLQALTASPAATFPDAVAGAVAALGGQPTAIGIDESGLGADGLPRLAARLAPTTVVRVAEHLRWARAIKSPYEIECLQRALGIAEEAANAVVQMLKPGVTEREASGVYESEVARRGALAYASIIGIGGGSALPAAYPTERTLRTGDLVRLDLGCVYKGYCSDLARTAVMGEPSPRQERVHAALQAGVEAALDAIKPEVTGAQVFEAGVEAVRAAGLSSYRRHHLGHGIGLEPAEPPRLAPDDGARLEAAMVLRVEAPYYEHGWGGLNVKETVLVTRTGFHLLNRSHRGLIVLD